MESAQEKEREILEFWKKNRIYEKSVKKNAKGKAWYFMDGPPYATGSIHMGTALNKILKDIAMRAHRMQGFNVFDRPGYDTHGVPIEFQVEKEIGSKSKQDIEKFGIKKFIEKCKGYATKYIDVMNNEFKNLGVWMDWNNPYLTLTPEYIEAIWHSFKEAEKKGLLYLGKYSVHVCPRCETAVAYNEIEYGKQKDTSIYVKFKLKNKKDTYLLIWTTTPWTLPANTGVMVHPDVDYQEIEVVNGNKVERWIVAKELVVKVMGMMERGFNAKKEYKGKEMKGWEYENPLSKYMNIKIKNGYRVVLSGRYVTTEDGTGLVHTAPGHGKEDYEVGKENGLDILSPVRSDGTLTEETGKYAGKKARVVDKEIMEDLEKDGALVHKLEYEHDYPLCWRDKSPLLMIAQPQWFLKISEIQKKLLKENDSVNWVPEWMKLRMKAWLEGIWDWPVSRQRYWGTPLPIWFDEKTGERIVVGSIEELEKLSGKKIKEVHKPEIDDIKIKSPKTGKELKRVPEVLDVWFDSGVSSWAALDYPEKKDLFKKFWPANLNIEGKDQFRGWWNSQIILSEINFGKKPFESIEVHGMILDLNKSKMSKSKGNIIAPEEVIEKYGRDFLRYYFAKLSKGDDFSYDEKEFREIQKVIIILRNLNKLVNEIDAGKGKLKAEDRWIISKYNRMVENVTCCYNSHRFFDAVQELEKFAVEDLSRKYIQIVRERIEEIGRLLNEMRIGLIQLFAPIIPFIAEEIWQELRAKKIVQEESVHLNDWPKADKKKIDIKLEKEFENAMKIVEAGLDERDKAGIGLRWPLKSADITANFDVSEELRGIIKNQLNVKEFYFDKIKEEIAPSVKLNTKITPELEAEGYAREVARAVQAERKRAGLQKGELVDVILYTGEKLRKMLEKYYVFLKERTNAKTLDIVGKTNKEKLGNSAKIKNEEIFIKFLSLGRNK